MRIIGWSIALGLALLAAGSAEAGDYTVLTTGRPSGAMTVTGDGAERSVVYSFNDRGRGPELKESYRTDARGMVEAATVKGVDYLKAPVDESFAIESGQARWSSQADQGSAAAGGFYLTYQSTPEDSAALVRALIKANGPMPLLPGGSAKLRKLLDREVSGPDGAKEIVSLYAVDGVGMTPFPVWLDDRQELFFGGSTWSGTVRKGWEEAAAGLVTAQDEAFKADEIAAARRLTRRPAGAVVIRNANLFDPKAKAMRPGMSVVVRGNRIEAVGPDRLIGIPQGAETVDAKGRALLPGLWDMHVHIADNNEGLLQLAAGVTSVRDMGNDMDELMNRRKRFASGELVGPRIFMAGFVDGPGPLAAPTKVLVSTPEEMIAAVNKYADNGYEQIKLYSSLKPELVPVAVKAAHARGLRVSGHIPAGLTAGKAVDLGFDEIQHVNFLLLNFYPDVAGETASMKRFTTIGERASSLDLGSAEVKAFIAKLKAKDIVIDPTVATFEGMFTAEPRVADPSLAAVAGRLPPAVARGLYGGGMAKGAEQLAQYRLSYKKMVEMVGLLHRAGVRMVPGTDGFDGFLLDREFELWRDAGVPNLDILYAATLGAASVNHHDKELGSIEPGKLADLALFEGDPSKDISALRRAAWVMKDGAVFDPAALYGQVNIRP